MRIREGLSKAQGPQEGPQLPSSEVSGQVSCARSSISSGLHKEREVSKCHPNSISS